MSTDNSQRNAISIRNLVVDYGQRRILSDVNLDIPMGQIMVIMGQSGAGKTTLLRCLLGHKKTTSGSLHILGTDIASASLREINKVRIQMGVAFQGGALFSSMSVAENIQLALRDPLCCAGTSTLIKRNPQLKTHRVDAESWPWRVINILICLIALIERNKLREVIGARSGH